MLIVDAQVHIWGSGTPYIASSEVERVIYQLSGEELERHCRAHLGGLPRNPAGKVLKRVLREELGGA